MRVLALILALSIGFQLPSYAGKCGRLNKNYIFNLRNSDLFTPDARILVSRSKKPALKGKGGFKRYEADIFDLDSGDQFDGAIDRVCKTVQVLLPVVVDYSSQGLGVVTLIYDCIGNLTNKKGRFISGNCVVNQSVGFGLDAVETISFTAKSTR